MRIRHSTKVVRSPLEETYWSQTDGRPPNPGMHGVKERRKGSLM